jgi:hypothetical protein
VYYCDPCQKFLRRPWLKTLSSVMLCSHGICAAYRRRSTCFNHVESDCISITLRIRVGVTSCVARFSGARGASNHNDRS